MAGLLLSNYNVLILDEPGNHLDVDTVDALAEALLEYKGPSFSPATIATSRSESPPASWKCATAG